MTEDSAPQNREVRVISNLKFLEHREYPINPETGIRFIRDWGGHCGIGFVSDQRFAGGGEQVIKRTNRTTTKKWRKLNDSQPGSAEKK